MRLDAAEKWARDLEPLAATLTPRRAAALATEEGRLEDAEKLLQQELLRAPHDAELHLLSGKLQARRGRDPAAEAALMRAMELDAKDFQAPLRLALLQSRRGLRRQARASFREALRRNPASSEARDGLRLLDAGWLWRAAIGAALLAALVLLLLLRRL
jgi:Flp pilus assembly protein TadD